MNPNNSSYHLANSTTPRLFVAATRQDDGKTTTCLGLFAGLRNRFGEIGYIKPVGQRFVEVEGHKVDEDTFLMNEIYQVRTPIQTMSPIAVEPDFTRRFLSGEQTVSLHFRVQRAFDEAAWEKDFVIIEGTGHAGVGSVFDLSNAKVAQLLQSKVIIVAQGGIGKPIDEIAMNLALFEKYGVEVIGAVFNKVLPEKIEELRGFAQRGLERIGLPLLGIIPLHQELYKPTLNQICQQIEGRFLSGGQYKRRRVGNVAIGAMSSRNIERHFQPGGLIITPGDRDDIITAILGDEESGGATIAGVILTSGMLPDESLLHQIRQRDIPFIAAENDPYTIASSVIKMTVKTEVEDKEKIAFIQDLVTNNLDFDRILDAVDSRTPVV